nr:glycoside hydrolase family 15 protein [uncultured Rhodopila sp.]
MSTPLEDYALIGDGESAALVSRDGSVDWLCWPRFDSAACFAALLGTPANGRWLIGLAEQDPSRSATRRYQSDTLVMETNLVAAGGAVRLIDFMPVREDVAALVRIVEGVEGTCRLRMDLRLRFDYGTMLPWTEATEDGFVATVGSNRITVTTPIPLELRAHAAEAVFSVTAGQRLVFVMQHHDATLPAPPPLDAEAALLRTQAFWRDWIARFNSRKTRWPDPVRRSLLTLKSMIHRPTGGLIAAPTTSLPEAPGGAMNWDYRYCWLRDSTFTLGALINAGYHDEARNWRDWLLRAIGGSPENMRIMYRVDGDRHLDEWPVAGLPGYRHALPVRIGNAASTQLQIDVWGEVVDTLHLADQAGLPGSRQADQVRKQLVEHLADVWNQPGAGIWESRNKPRHYTYSRVMAWVAVDRFVRAFGSGAGENLLRRMKALRRQIHDEVCREGWNDGLGTFTQYFGGQELDAGLLLLPLVGFLPAGDPRMAGTIAAIRRDLGEGGFIRRTRHSGTENPEGAFLACSCWMADCLNLLGKSEEAAAQFERVLDVRNDVGLLSEEFNVPARHLAGNFPQALTHLAVVNTGLSLSGPVINRGGG